jgi:hypothetical protein
MNRHPDRSVVQWRACPERSRTGTCCSLHPQRQSRKPATLPFVISPAPACRGSGAEGSAVLWTFLGNVFRQSVQMKCHPDRSEAQWRDLLFASSPTKLQHRNRTGDLLFASSATTPQETRHSPLFHPERSRGICNSTDLSWKCFSTERTNEVSSRLSRAAVGPERTRTSCHAAMDEAACAPFRKEGRMKCTNATKIKRKSGVA